MEQTIKTIDTFKISMTIKMNAKGEAYGEYTVKAENATEAEKLLNECTCLYRMYTG